MNTLKCSLGHLCPLIAGLVLTLIASSVQAQDQFTSNYAPKLAQTVHLTIGKTTLADALTELSKQTGLQIDAAEYLRDRVLVVQMDGITGRAALDALTALNDLKWSAAGPNHLVIDRPTVKRPDNVLEVPNLLAQALPRDIRDCLLVGIPQEKGWEFARPDTFQGKHDFEYPRFLRSRAGNLLKEQSDLFLASLPVALPMGAKIAYRTLTPRQQSQLLSILFFREIARLSSDLVYDNLAPYQKDATQASLHLHSPDNLLEIGTITQQGDKNIYRFFGAVVNPPPAGEGLADKKP